jgi:rod shape-determining protein MreD
MNYGRGRYRFATVLLLLVVSHFALRPWFVDERWAPDFLLLALLIYSIRSTPGRASVAGLLVGLFADASHPERFGSGALGHTIVGYLAAWGKAVFFAENVLVSGAFFFVGTWIRDVLVLLAGGYAGASTFFWQIAFWSPLKAMATAIVGMGVLMVFQRWLEVRVVE